MVDRIKYGKKTHLPSNCKPLAILLNIEIYTSVPAGRAGRIHGTPLPEVHARPIGPLRTRERPCAGKWINFKFGREHIKESEKRLGTNFNCLLSDHERGIVHLQQANIILLKIGVRRRTSERSSLSIYYKERKQLRLTYGQAWGIRDWQWQKCPVRWK